MMTHVSELCRFKQADLAVVGASGESHPSKGSSGICILVTKACPARSSLVTWYDEQEKSCELEDPAALGVVQPVAQHHPS